MLSIPDQVRLRVQDLPLVADVTQHGDGTANTFALAHRNAVSATAFVPGAGGTSWSATGATVDPTGFVSFSGVISANSAYRVRYVHSTFSEDEVGQFITAGGGSVPGAALEACRALMFDSLKRASWAAPDGSQYDDTKAQAQLLALHEQLMTEVANAELTDGGFVSWVED